MKKLFNKLYSELALTLISLDYEAFPARRQFRRISENGYHSMILSVAGQQPTEIEVFLGIRIDMVEELAYQFTDGLKEYGPYSTTLIVPARKISSEPQYFYSLTTEGDIPEIQRKIMLFMNEQGFPFLKEYGNVKALDKLYNQNPEQKLSYVTNEFHRALRGIVLAKLAQQSSWKELVEQYRTKLQKRGLPEVQMQRYERLANFLTNYSFS
ncbi:hypothetical protein [Tunicatimonas pelagia]|uniref:hypothetical protein n=1 Tax=Tunicatimonas pelagia TaxID=931531 RepID=UPI002665055F|nr:hypothetical protein [Tunicatimonas pelagia]WKN46049.1 hypothetical protein P0M28_13925 [Tunicatimonas pelagia]